ncbi:PREDICTED: rhophilin-2 isoform X1 [Acromyrmex echinatior]|uniref:rhophilin-2 isoform X1 n=1 Tax=Acromyrmex echinatior TaxID=103372 RepID=UPI00058100A6|nr:PREDICTED: rhophilin-2 isoform X1 [Acromyrmex echinatior]
MLKWVHYCPLPKDRASVSSDTKVIDPSEITRDEKDERRIYERRKYGADTGSSLNTRNAKIATPDAIMRRYFRFGGSDPRVATCRGKLQNKRSKLNQEINKELRLRAGAENLFKATTNRKLKETVALELSFVNSNLQLLKEQLAELNSSVELYQNVDGTEPVMPMIPLGLKETKDIDFRDPFKDFILEHYSEDGENYEEAIADLMETRQATRTPTRDSAGIALLLRYYNQLYFIERRFFPPDRSLGIYFEWFDSLTGVPSCQRTVAFEKASILFNAGALYTQLAAKQDRLTARGLDQAVDAFLRAAGTFRYIHENFTNAPSMDLGPDMLEMLVQLMLAQARECLFEKLELQSKDSRNVDVCLDLAQEAAQVAAIYNDVHGLISREPVRDYVPETWISLILVKREHHLALAHKHIAVGLLDRPIAEFRVETKLTLEHIQKSDGKTQLDATIPRDDNERKLLGKAHLREALVLHDESQRLQRMCRELKGKQALAKVLKKAQEATFESYNRFGNEDDFRELLDPPDIIASTKFQLSITHPDFGQHGVDDLFKSLGPVAIFSAKRHWTAPRLIQLQRGPDGEGFGFSVRGDAPVIVAAVDHNSLADVGGMKEGDFIVGISEKDVKWASHEQVVRMIKQCGDFINLKLVTPMDRNYLKMMISEGQQKKYDEYKSTLDAETLEIARLELREDDNMREQALKQFRHWIEKHPAIKKCRTDSLFLLRFLRTKKFSLPMAQEMLEQYLTIRQLHSNWFQNLDVDDPELMAIIDNGYIVPMLKRDQHGRKVIMSFAGRFDPSKFSSAHLLRVHSMVVESLMDDEKSQVYGYTYLNDEAGLSMNHFGTLSFMDIRNILKCIQNSTPMRHKETHLINLPSGVAKFLEFAISLLNEKLRSRVMIHRNIQELKEAVDPKILPKEYGGEISLSEMIDEFKKELKQKKDELKALDDMYIEISPKYYQEANEELSGICGSFRKLEVD